MATEFSIRTGLLGFLLVGLLLGWYLEWQKRRAAEGEVVRLRGSVELLEQQLASASHRAVPQPEVLTL